MLTINHHKLATASAEFYCADYACIWWCFSEVICYAHACARTIPTWFLTAKPKQYRWIQTNKKMLKNMWRSDDICIEAENAKKKNKTINQLFALRWVDFHWTDVTHGLCVCVRFCAWVTTIGIGRTLFSWQQNSADFRSYTRHQFWISITTPRWYQYIDPYQVLGTRGGETCSLINVVIDIFS